MGEQADYIIDREIERHLTVNGLAQDNFISDLKYKMKAMEEFVECDFWTTGNGDMIYYHQLEEQHARNILRQIEKLGHVPNPKLLKRIKYFDSLKPQWKELF